MINTIILNKALSQYGIKEIVGDQDNHEVLKYFDIMGFDGKKLKDETSWCSAIVNWVAIECGCKASFKLTARSWLKIGQKVSKPLMGDVVVFWRESRESWKGHVGFFIREDDQFIYCLGGNQGNEVNISKYPKNRLLGYRRL